MTDDVKVTVIFGLLCDLGCLLGVHKIPADKELFRHQVDDNWRFVMNRHTEPVELDTGPLSPCCAIIYWQDMPVMIAGVSGGSMLFPMSDPEGDFIDALEKHIADIKKGNS